MNDPKDPNEQLPAEPAYDPWPDVDAEIDGEPSLYEDPPPPLSEDEFWPEL